MEQSLIEIKYKCELKFSLAWKIWHWDKFEPVIDLNSKIMTNLVLNSLDIILIWQIRYAVFVVVLPKCLSNSID
jgi:hypothetical protein